MKLSLKLLTWISCGIFISCYAIYSAHGEENIDLKEELSLNDTFNTSVNETNPIDFVPNNIPYYMKYIISLPYVVKELNGSHRIAHQQRLDEFCKQIELVYKKLNWQEKRCLEIPWNFDLISEQGQPLVYFEFNDLDSKDAHKLDNTTLIFGGVHPDEITPIHMAFRLSHILENNTYLYRNARVIVAPLVNPDGFFSNPKRRTNTNGIDLNRNFPTYNNAKTAYNIWISGKGKDSRNFPGVVANSEQGTRFQIDLISNFKPNKIISIHAPLGFLDLDYQVPKMLTIGPQTGEQRKAKVLAEIISRSAANYRIKDFGTYPGSLGNYAGNERTIPTITLELSSSNARLADKFWMQFSPGLFQALKYEFRRQDVVAASLLLRKDKAAH